MTSSSGLSDADQAAIRSVNDTFVARFLAGDFAGVAALYTDDAVLMPPNSPRLTGRAAIAEFLSSFPPVTGFELVPGTVDGSGDLAFVTGTYRLTMTGEDESAVEDVGKFIEIRRRVGDTWLLAHDMFNSDMPVE